MINNVKKTINKIIKMPEWLKFGLGFLFFYVIFGWVFLLIVKLGCPGAFCILGSIPASVILFPVYLFYGQIYYAEEGISIFFVVMGVIIYFIGGALIGWIYGFIKDKIKGR